MGGLSVIRGTSLKPGLPPTRCRAGGSDSHPISAVANRPKRAPGAASGNDSNGAVSSHRQRRPRGLRLSAPSTRLLRPGADFRPRPPNRSHRTQAFCSQSSEYWTRRLRSESYRTSTGCAPILGARACGVTSWDAGFHGLSYLQAGEAQAGKSVMYLHFLRIRVTSISRAVANIPRLLQDKLR